MVAKIETLVSTQATATGNPGSQPCLPGTTSRASIMSSYSMKPKPFMSLISVILPVPWAPKWLATSSLVAAVMSERLARANPACDCRRDAACWAAARSAKCGGRCLSRRTLSGQIAQIEPCRRYLGHGVDVRSLSWGERATGRTTDQLYCRDFLGRRAATRVVERCSSKMETGLGGQGCVGWDFAFMREGGRFFKLAKILVGTGRQGASGNVRAGACFCLAGTRGANSRRGRHAE